MKLRKLIAASATGVAVAFGVIGGGLGVATAADPFEGHDPAWCSGLYDGSQCWTDQTGTYTHLDFGERP